MENRTEGDEEGLLFEVIGDKGNIAKADVTARLKAIKTDSDAEDERKLLTEYLDLTEQESAANKQVKEAQKELASQVAAQYGKLTESEIKSLVVDDKWLARLAADVQSELDRVSQSLKRIVDEKLVAGRAAYGQKVLAALSQQLVGEFGDGYSVTVHDRGRSDGVGR